MLRRSLVLARKSITGTLHPTTPPKPDINSPEKDEILSCLVLLEDAETRRSGLLTLFRLSLQEDLEPLLAELGAVEACIKGLALEDVGSAAKRAGLQTLRNVAGCAKVSQRLMDAKVPEVCVTALKVEEVGSGQAEAALETLRNLALIQGNRSGLAMVPELLNTVLAAARTEKRDSVGREAAMNTLELLATDAGIKVRESEEKNNNNKNQQFLGGSSTNLKDGSNRMRAASMLRVTRDERAGSKSVLPDVDIDLDGLIAVCVETVAQEPQGSQARAAAARTIGNVVLGGEEDRVFGTPQLIETLLRAAREEGPGAETRARVFGVFADLASFPKFRVLLMKVKDLAETIISAVRDEAPGSAAREFAMYVVGRLCMNPENRSFFLRGQAEGLVPMCVKAAGQEPPGSSGRAAALEVLAGLALAPENQDALYRTPGLVKMAVESSATEAIEENAQIREAGLNLLASLAGHASNCRALFTTHGVGDAVCKAITMEPANSIVREAAIAAVRAFASNAENLKTLKAFPKLSHSLVDAVQTEGVGSRARAEALVALAEHHGFLDMKKDLDDAKFLSALVDASRQESPGSEERSAAFRLLQFAVEHGHHTLVQSAGALDAALTVVRVAAPSSATSTNNTSSSSRMMLRKVTTNRPGGGPVRAPPTPEEIRKDAACGLSLLACAAKFNLSLPDGSFETTHSMCSPNSESITEDMAMLACFIATRAVRTRSQASDLATKSNAVTTCVCALKEKKRLSEALSCLFAVSSLDEATSAFDETSVQELIDFITVQGDQGDTPGDIQAPAIGALLHLLFHVPFANFVRSYGRRGDLEASLTRVTNRGVNDDVWYDAARRVEGVSLALRNFGGVVVQAKLPAKKDAKTTVPVVVVSPFHGEAHKTAHALADALNQANTQLKKEKKPQIHATVLDPEVSKVKKAQRKQTVDDVFAALTGSNAAVIFCVSVEFEYIDPLCRLYTWVASASSIPIIALQCFDTSDEVERLGGRAWFNKFKTENPMVFGAIPVGAVPTPEAVKVIIGKVIV